MPALRQASGQSGRLRQARLEGLGAGRRSRRAAGAGSPGGRRRRSHSGGVLGNARVQLFGPVPFALLLQHQRQVPEDAGLVGIDLQGFFVAGAGARQVAQLLLRHAQVEVAPGRSRG